MSLLIKQKTPTTCGHCCVAMLTGDTVEQVIDRVGHADIMDDDDIARAFGFDTLWQEGPAPDTCVALQFHREPNGDRGHWTISHMGVLLDPAEIGDRLWSVEKHAIWIEPD